MSNNSLFSENEIQEAHSFFKKIIKEPNAKLLEDKKTRASGLAAGLGFSAIENQIGFRAELQGRIIGHLVIGRHYIGQKNEQLEYWIFKKGQSPKLYINDILQEF